MSNTTKLSATSTSHKSGTPRNPAMFTSTEAYRPQSPASFANWRRWSQATGGSDNRKIGPGKRLNFRVADHPLRREIRCLKSANLSYDIGSQTTNWRNGRRSGLAKNLRARREG